MERVRAKKWLGQHFLKDKNVAARITKTLTGKGYSNVIEVGPGTGVLTRFLVEREFERFVVSEIDSESVAFLKEEFADKLEILEQDFLKIDLEALFGGKLAVIGNFPYNISSQIFFRVLKYRSSVVEVTGMIQKEVAERIRSGPGTKSYGILSVLLGAWFDIELLFTVPPHLFIPPPKVTSAVIRLRRNSRDRLGCNENLFFIVVKTAFNQRRKTLRNALGARFSTDGLPAELLSKRAEQLSVTDFEELTRVLEEGSAGRLS